MEANALPLKHQNAALKDGKERGHINGYGSDGEKQSSIFPSDCTGGFFADQFETMAKIRAHYEGRGPEIWEQSRLDAFIAAAGTGGTVASVSSLFNKVPKGVMYTKELAEGRRLKNPFDTITEGIGINRLTQNFMMATLDGALQGTDKEAVEMSRFLVKNDRLILGSYSATNCIGAVRVAQWLGPGHALVTILCNSGMRHLRKFYDAQNLFQLGPLQPD